MTRLDEIQERHSRAGLYYSAHEWCWSDVQKDIRYLLGLLKSYPASEPPDDERMVLVRTVNSTRRQGRYRAGFWWLFGNLGLKNYRDAVVSWQELPPESKK